MSTAARKTNATYRDIEDMPESVIAEIIDGELYMQARPTNLHAEALGTINELLRPPYQRGRGGPGGWWILPEPQISFGDRDWRTLVPDIAGWRKERVPKLPEKYFDVAPDWVCEILSPSTRLNDRNVKARVYAEEGVKHLWLVDPAYRTLDCFENTDGEWIERGQFEGTADIAAPPFDAVPFDLADLWPPD